MASYVVKTLQLNLRSGPSAGAARVAVLAQGTELTKIADAPAAGWWQVDADIQGHTVRGFVNSGFVAPQSAGLFAAVTAAAGTIPPADLGPSTSAKRTSTGSQAFAIGEPGRPARAASHPNGLVAGILAVIDWADVGDHSHVRWQPTGATTFCNVYTYDICNIAGIYLPRVWWTHDALVKLQAGQSVDVKYGQTVDEIRANQIYNWLRDFGAGFGWQRVFDPDPLQTQVNSGMVGIICAQRVDINRPGHIQIVAPENGNNTAKRVGGKVTQPLQSNAGTTTFTYGILGNSWWRSANFREFGFWVGKPT
jgi:hypothetical protein